MFRVPLRFLSSLFFFLILSQLSRIKTRLWFSVLLICCRPRPHTGGSHISQTIGQTYQRENSGNHLRSFTLLLHLYFSGQHNSPLRPPLSDPLCCSLSGGWHTLSAFFFFPARFFIFIPDVETRSPQGGKRRFSLSRLSPDGGLWKHWRVCRMYLEGCELFSSFVPFSSL